MPGVNIYTEFEHEGTHGVLKNIRHNAGESTGENTVTLEVKIFFNQNMHVLFDIASIANK